jgi:hypothetical protein
MQMLSLLAERGAQTATPAVRGIYQTASRLRFYVDTRGYGRECIPHCSPPRSNDTQESDSCSQSCSCWHGAEISGSVDNSKQQRKHAKCAVGFGVGFIGAFSMRLRNRCLQVYATRQDLIGGAKKTSKERGKQYGNHAREN